MRHCANTSSGGHTGALNVVCGGERWLIGTVSSPPLFLLLLSCGFSQGPPPCWHTARLHQITSQNVCLYTNKHMHSQIFTNDAWNQSDWWGREMGLALSLFHSPSLSFFIYVLHVIEGLPEVPVWRGFRIKERRSPWQCSHNRLYSPIKPVIMWNGTHGPIMRVAAHLPVTSHK